MTPEPGITPTPTPEPTDAPGSDYLPQVLNNPYDWQQVTDHMPTATLAPAIDETNLSEPTPEPVADNNTTAATIEPSILPPMPTEELTRIGFSGLAQAAMAALAIGCAIYIIFLGYIVIRK